jgi:hypothetical protein
MRVAYWVPLWLQSNLMLPSDGDRSKQRRSLDDACAGLARGARKAQRFRNSQQHYFWMQLLSHTETWSLLALTTVCFGILFNILQSGREGEPLIASIAFSGIAFSATYCLIRWLGDAFMKVGFKGKDMSKLKKVEMLVLA